MKLFSLFTEKAPNKVFFSIVLGAMAGLCYSFLIPIVLNSIGYEERAVTTVIEEVNYFLGFEVTHYKFATLFFFTCLAILFFRTFSQILLVSVAMDISADLRTKIYRHIINAPIDQLDKMGPSRIIAIITADVGRIVAGARVLPDILISAVTLVGLLSFLLYLNIQVFWFVIASIIFGGVTYQIPIYIGSVFFAKAREHLNDLHEGIRGIVYGTKELKLNDEKREYFFREILLDSERKLLKADKIGHSLVTAGTNYGDLISFFVIAVVSFIFISYQSMQTTELVGVIMALLYLTGPVAIILNSISQVAIAKVSLRSVKKLLDDIPQESIDRDTTRLNKPWNSITFSGVCYEYHSNDDSFKLGPIDLEIEKAKITFIVGGNGSGKSTLSKVLALHYKPSEGEIRFGDLVVDSHTLTSCRQVISAIFTDYYLFKSLLIELNDINRQMINQYLKELGLDTKVELTGNGFSTINLSDGQKKRLALLVSFIEDRDLYIFDEWAADQDPEFKNVFYYHILPQLKDKGKAVVVISHDDRYFGLADTVIVMSEGKVVDIEDSIFADKTKGEHNAQKLVAMESGM